MKGYAHRRKTTRNGDSGLLEAIRYISKQTRMPHKDVRYVLMTFRAFIETELTAGRSVFWRGMGIFGMYLRPGRIVKMPANAAKQFRGTTIVHKTAYYPFFKVSNYLKKRTKHTPENHGNTEH
jgi:nucleoid DNA-binding protein